MPLMKEKRISVAGVELAVAVEQGQAERLKQTAPYRYAVRPALNWLERLGGRRNGHPDTGEQAFPAPPGSVPTRTAQVQGPTTPEARAILDRVAPIEWYHTLELPHGVVTPGFVDHREQLHYYPLPDDMRGLRCLDVATFDGFWAFQMEKRGAEVVGIDVDSVGETDIPRNWVDVFQAGGYDKPKGAGFRLAKELLNSKVERVGLNANDLSPEKVGMFDVTFCSDLLLHIRDPLRIMENIYRVTKQYAIIADVYNPDLEGFKGRAVTEFCMAGNSDVWWRPSSTCLYLQLLMARFSRVEEVSRFKLTSHFAGEIPKVVYKAYK